MDPVVLCPLRFERRRLRRARLGRRATLACCGPGASAVARWAAEHDPRGPVILCGLAGSLRDSHPAGSACAAGAVLRPGGGRLEPPLLPPAPDIPRAVIASTPGTLTSLRAKRDCAAHSGADVVDLESAAFAEAAAGRGWRWAIVRGVCDGPDTPLPDDIDEWVDLRGRTRPGRACRALLGRRTTLAALLRLRADGAAALKGAARIVERILNAHDG